MGCLVGRTEALRGKLELLTQEELAQVLDVTSDTLREWRRLKQGPDFVKAGKNVMYRERDVLAWLTVNVVIVMRTALVVACATITSLHHYMCPYWCPLVQTV